jgi:alternative sigma factor RpoH
MDLRGAIAICLAVAAAYGSVLGFPFVAFDDPLYVLDNAAWTAPPSERLEHLLLTPTLGYPIPVPVLMYALERKIHGLQPGLMHAVKKFDPDRGYRLITYAVWWIRAAIQSFILKSWSLVKLGTGRARRKLFFRLRSARSRMEQAAQGIAADAHLASELGVTLEELGEMQLRLAVRDYSLDAPLSDDTQRTHVDLLAASGGPEAHVERQEAATLVHGAVAAVLDTLDAREQAILSRRLLAEEPETLADLGNSFGISRERARQLEQRLIGKLRAQIMPAAAA